MISEVRLTATESYYLGALVSIYSFLQHNPWFKGCITVYTLPEHYKQLSSYLGNFPKLKVTAASAQLTSTIDNAISDSQHWIPERFLSLQMLADEAEGDVLLIDADLLFTSSIESLNTTSGNVAACRDGAAYRGSGVHRVTNAEIVKEKLSLHHDKLVGQTFNSGFIRIGADLLGAELFKDALSLVNTNTLGQVTRRHHDQFILNRLFESKWQTLDATFNYLLAHQEAIYQVTGNRLTDAHVIHFNIHPKPWDLTSVAQIADPRLAHAIALWLRCYADMIKTLALGRATAQLC